MAKAGRIGRQGTTHSAQQGGCSRGGSRIGIEHDPLRVPVAVGWDCRLIIYGLMGALYAPADNQARFQTAAYFSHQLPLSARVAAGAGVLGKGGSPMYGLHVGHVDSWRPRIRTLMNSVVQIVVLMRS